MAGLDDESAQYATLGMGSMNVIMTVISMFIVERAGRKTLLLIGFTGMCIDTLLLTIALAYAVSNILITAQCTLWECL